LRHRWHLHGRRWQTPKLNCGNVRFAVEIE
jgi:hypothetical protein